MILKNFLKKTFKNLPGYQKGFYLCGPKQSTDNERFLRSEVFIKSSLTGRKREYR
jgi:hypothetical protein